MTGGFVFRALIPPFWKRTRPPAWRPSTALIKRQPWRGTFGGFDQDRSGELPPAPEPRALNTAPPPGSFRQLATLIRRQVTLLARDKAQLVLQFVLVVTFPGLVAIFGYKGLKQVPQMSLTLDPNIVHNLAETVEHLRDSVSAASLVSGLSMFQVILLTLIGANNGAREIAKEREVLEKELRAGLSPWAYCTTKSLLVTIFSLVQAFWMTWFVKTICRFPRRFPRASSPSCFSPPWR